MNNLIDFNECRTFLNDYEGADTKLKIQFNNEIYMLKLGKELEHDDKKPLQASHSNTPVAEYLGSHIFQMMGIPAQETLLGSFNGRLAVACRDFVSNRSDASNVKLTSSRNLKQASSTALLPSRKPLFMNLSLMFSRTIHILSQFGNKPSTDIGKLSLLMR